MTRKRSTLLALCITIAVAGAVGTWVHAVSAAQTRLLTTPPKLIAGKFKPNPDLVGAPTAAHLLGIATPPEQVYYESLVSLNWSWHVDKVQLKPTPDAAYTNPPPSFYDVSITSGNSIDPNAVVVFKPKRAGLWKVTVHATATYANITGEIFVGNSESKDLFVTAAETLDAPATGETTPLPHTPK